LYKTNSCVLNVGSILGSSIEAVGLGINGTSNRTHGSEQEKGNLGDLHGEWLEALVETIGKMDKIITGGIGLDEIDIS
jgi:hypothetical protein